MYVLNGVWNALQAKQGYKGPGRVELQYPEEREVAATFATFDTYATVDVTYTVVVRLEFHVASYLVNYTEL